MRCLPRPPPNWSNCTRRQVNTPGTSSTSADSYYSLSGLATSTSTPSSWPTRSQGSSDMGLCPTPVGAPRDHVHVVLAQFAIVFTSRMVVAVTWSICWPDSSRAMSRIACSICSRDPALSKKARRTRKSFTSMPVDESPRVRVLIFLCTRSLTVSKRRESMVAVEVCLTFLMISSPSLIVF